jgi:retinol dehydrogenase 14
MAANMKDKAVLVTGATQGIGRQTALNLCRAGARILLHGRNAARGQEVASDLREASGNNQVEYVNADFSSLRQVDALAREIRQRCSRLDVVISNAALYSEERIVTDDGLELTFAVNHLAPFALITALIDLLQASPPSRVIVVSSGAHRNAHVDFDNLQGEKHYDGHQAYALSKLANILFTYRLARILVGSSVTANCLNPGVIETNLLRAGWGGGGRSLESGAETPSYLATDPDAGKATGQYFVDKRLTESAPQTYDIALQERMWLVGQSLTQAALDRG